MTMRSNDWVEVDPDDEQTLPPEWKRLEVVQKNGLRYFGVYTKGEFFMLSRRFAHGTSPTRVFKWRKLSQKGFDQLGWWNVIEPQRKKKNGLR